MFYAVDNKLLRDPDEVMEDFEYDEILPRGFYTNTEWTNYIIQRSVAIRRQKTKEAYSFIIKENYEYV